MTFLQEQFQNILIAAVSTLLILQLFSCGVQYSKQNHIRQLELIKACKDLGKEPIIDRSYDTVMGCR